MTRRPTSAVCALLIGVVPAQADQLVFEGKALPDPALTKLVTEIASDMSVEVPLGQTLAERLVEQCGNNLTYLELARQRGELASVMAKRASDAVRYTVPPCIRPGAFGKVEVKKNDTALAIAGRRNFDFTRAINSNRAFDTAVELAAAEVRSAFVTTDGGVVDMTTASSPVSVPTSSVDVWERALEQAMASKNSRAYVRTAGYVFDKAPAAPTVSAPTSSAEVWKRAMQMAAAPSTQTSPNLTTGIDLGFDPEWIEAHQTFAGFNNRVAFQTINGLDQSLTITAGKSVFVPYELPQIQSLSLKPGAQADQIAMFTKAAIDAGIVGQITKARQPELLGDIDASECGNRAERSGDWPFDRLRLLQQMGQNEIAGATWKGASIMVVDTGFPAVSGAASAEARQRFDKEVARIYPESSRHELVGSGTDKKFAYSLADRRPGPGVMANYKGDRWHGLAVGLVAAGGGGFEEFRRLLPGRPSVSFASMLKDDGGVVKLDASALANAAKLADDKRAEIINVSYLEPGRDNTVNALKILEGTGALLIAAAGNDGTDMDKVKTDDYPLQAGGDPANAGSARAMTIGASNYARAPHPKSRRSAKYVDLFAPGCGIPTYIFEEDGSGVPALKRASVNGTSFAAPLVSFAAALLRGYGFNAVQTKSRLQFTVDVDPAYEALSYAPGNLNVGRAMSFPFDAYEVKSADGGTRTLLELDGRSKALSVCGEEIETKDTARLAIKGNKLYRWKTPNQPDRDPVDHYSTCDLKTAGAFQFETFAVSDFLTGEVVDVSVDTLLDFTGRSAN